MAGYVGEVALPYDRTLVPVLFDYYGAEVARRTADRSVKHVLEIAAGTGAATRHLRNLLPREARLTAIDISEDMMALNQQKFMPHEQIEFLLADAMELPFDNESFDAVVCQFGIMFYDRDVGFREVYRALKSGGRYLFSVWDGPHYNPFSGLFFELMKQMFPANPPRFLFEPVCCAEIDPIKEKLIRAGFERIAVSVMPRVHDLVDVRSYARGIVYCPVIDEIRACGGDPDEVVEEFTKLLVREYGANPTRYPMQAIMFQAEKP